MDADAADPQLPLGTRVLLGGRHAATVRYVGPVDGQSGTWVGIEYDEPGRGKHDGCHAGRRYFSCASGPATGSLVRLPKFLEAADCGRSLVDAACERYDCSDAGGSARSSAGDASSDASAAGAEGEGGVHRMYLSTAGNRRVAVELVEKAGGAAARRASASGAGGAVLVGQRISSVGSAEEVQQALPGLSELDLSHNLIASWAFVTELAAALPQLHTLNLSGNRLALPSLPGSVTTAAPGAGSNAAEQAQQPSRSVAGGGSSGGSQQPMPAATTVTPTAQPASLTGIRTLVLNGCGATWQQAVAIAQQLPNLRELHLCNNGMCSLQLPGQSAARADGGSGGGGGYTGSEGPSTALAGLSLNSLAGSSSSSSSQLLAAAFPELEVLDLEGNELSSWADVAALSTLPRLRSLQLSGNRLPDVRYSGGFTSLRSLLLGSNRLADWAAVDALNRFPALEDARLSDNPLTAATPSSARYQCIARIRGLATLNASAVSPAERWDAEINYLRLVTDELAAAVAGAAGGDAAAAREAVLVANPRFGELTQKYGELTPAAPKAATGSALAASMAQLTVCHNGKTSTKKLPVSLTVGKLKLMLERLLRVKAAQQALLLVPPESSGAQPEDITDDDTRELRYYDVCDGCRLEVSTADPAARAAALAAAKAAAAAAHAARMEQHEKTIQQFRAVKQRLMA